MLILSSGLGAAAVPAYILRGQLGPGQKGQTCGHLCRSLSLLILPCLILPTPAVGDTSSGDEGARAAGTQDAPGIPESYQKAPGLAPTSGAEKTWGRAESRRAGRALKLDSGICTSPGNCECRARGKRYAIRLFSALVPPAEDLVVQHRTGRLMRKRRNTWRIMRDSFGKE